MKIQDHSFETVIFALLIAARYFGLNSELLILGGSLLGLGMGYKLGGVRART